MKSALKHGGRRGVFLAAAATALLTALGALLVLTGLAPSTGEAPSAEGSPAAGASPPPSAPATISTNSADNPEANADTAPIPHFLPGSPPVALDIPAIAVRSTTIVGLGLQADGSIEVPKDADQPGWYSPGPSPGQLGPAVIAGHVDSDTGPAVFYRLGDLRAGDRVKVTRADGTTATFSIDRVATYAKDEFPTRAVYGATNNAELRLITCSGAYDEETGYDSNTVAFAHLI